MRKVNLVSEEKARIRREVLARRDALTPEDRAQASAAIRDRLLVDDVVTSARTLPAFASFGTEVQLDSFLRDRIDRGVGVFLPYIPSMSPPVLEVVRVTHLDRDLVPARMGIREPDPHGRRPARVNRLDVVIAPASRSTRQAGGSATAAGSTTGRCRDWGPRPPSSLSPSRCRSSTSSRPRRATSRSTRL